MSWLSFSPKVGGPGIQLALDKVLNLRGQSWKSLGVTSLGKLLGSAVAEIFMNLFVSGFLGTCGGGGRTVGGPPPDAAPSEQSAVLAFFT